MTTTTLRTMGMTCGSCVSAVESAFEGVDGIGTASVSLAMERTVVTHDAEKISAQEIREMIEDRGFDADILSSDRPESPLFDVVEEASSRSPQTGGLTITTIRIGGMTCSACKSWFCS
jgi:P-type Cu+ transporter